MSYHCLDCGTELVQKSITESTDKYYCHKCQKYWYKVRRIIIEWIKKDS